MATTDARLYTLDEAALELARQECGMHGHSWRVIETAEQPVALVCERCSKSYAVVPR